jgi:tetratricopeptide (TPR) repeat protein
LENEDGADLTKAIDAFRRAVELDRGFSLAYYRLGLCLQRDSQPGAAVDEFRASYLANPDFVPAASWAARTLYSFDSHYPLQPAPLPLGANLEKEEGSDQRREAREIWTRLTNLPAGSISMAELQKAYYGLCQYEMEKDAAASASYAPDRVYFLPYFYCRKAEGLFGRLSSSERLDHDARSLQAVILYQIGLTLDHHRQSLRSMQPEPEVPRPLPCQAAAYRSADVLRSGPTAAYVAGGRARQALRYYKRSLALVANDPVVGCHAAMAESFTGLGDPRPLRALEKDAAVRFTVAADLEYMARDAADQQPVNHDVVSQYFVMALDEYQRAVMLDSAYFDALNGYAYTCWEWYLSYRQGLASRAPSAAVQQRAESHAREAVRLAYERQNRELEAAALDTLGEVLLGQGRLTESILNLNQSLERYTAWPSSHETHWDLAAAEWCSASASKTDAKAHLQRTYEHLGKLRAEERTPEGQLQEWHPFHPNLDLRIHDVTDAELSTVCPSDRATKAKPGTFEFLTPAYSSADGCEVTAVTAIVEPKLSLDQKPYLHVWGGNTNDRIPIAATQQRSIQVDVPADGTSEYYAAIEREDASPLSAMESFNVYSAKGCNRNAIRLTFRFITPSK